MLVSEIKKQIIKNQVLDKSKWGKGVSVLSYDIVEYLPDDMDITLDDITNKKVLLNGATNWKQASWGGSFYIYDEDIATLLCTPSELKRTRYGEKQPSKNEQWLDVQARALGQAENRIKKIVKGCGVA